MIVVKERVVYLMVRDETLRESLSSSKHSTSIAYSALITILSYFLYRNMAAEIAQAGVQQDFLSALERVGFNQDQRIAIVETSGCLNMAMLGLLSATQVSKICKRTETRPINPIRINTVQEQLLLAMRFWVIQRQRLQLPVDATQFNMIVALNQAQIMRQQAEDDARSDKEPVAKAPDKFKSAT